MKTLPTWLGHSVACILSLTAAFFGTFNVLFSDIFGLKQQASAVVYVLIIYTVLSGLLYWLWPGHGKAWRLWLIIPAAVISAFITLSDFANILYPLTVIAAVIGGSWFGSSVFNRQKHDTNAPLKPPAGESSS